MPYSYPTVMIGSTPYAVYGDVAAAQLYLQADMSAQATAWLTADATTQARALVAAVRWLDQQNWLGAPTDVVTPQSLQWPRVDMIDQFGNPIDPNTIPANVQFANFELAAGLADNPDLRAELQNATPRELRAGTAHITYFRPIGFLFGGKDVQTLTPFPQNVMDLIAIWLAGSQGALPIRVTDVKAKSPFDDDLGLRHGF